MRIILLFFIVSFIIGADQPAPLPAEVQKTLNVLELQMADLQHKAVKDIRKAAIDLGKQGNLDAALLAKKAADDLENTIKSNQTEDVLGNPVVSGVALYNGRWLSGGSETDAFEFKNGEYHCLVGNGMHQPQWASGKLVLVNPTTLTFNSANGVVCEFRIVDNDNILEGGRKLWTKAKAPKP